MVEIEVDDLIWPRLVEVIREINSKNRCYKAVLTRQTRVVEDLHLIGDPAFDLLEALGREFGSDFSSFPFRRYFLSEGFFMIPIFLENRKATGDQSGPAGTGGASGVLGYSTD